MKNAGHRPYVIVAIVTTVRSEFLKTPNSLVIVSVFKPDTLCFSTNKKCRYHLNRKFFYCDISNSSEQSSGEQTNEVVRNDEAADQV
jgi:hypothetical protein